MNYQNGYRHTDDYAEPERRKFPSRGWVIVDGEHVKQYGAYSHGYLLNYCTLAKGRGLFGDDGYVIGNEDGDALTLLCWRKEVVA